MTGQRIFGCRCWAVGLLASLSAGVLLGEMAQRGRREDGEGRLKLVWPGGEHSGREFTTRQAPAFFVASPGAMGSATRYTACAPGWKALFGPREISFRSKRAEIRMRFAGANRSARIEAIAPPAARVNFLIGRDRRHWKTDVPAYAGLAYRAIYPGIDAVYSGTGARLKSEFVLAPGADPSAIRLVYAGVDRIELDPGGALLLKIAAEALRESAPEIYQESEGDRERIAGGFRLFPDGSVGFQVGAYDRTRPLIIDPVIAYSTFLGGSRFDSATGIAVDAEGNAYITGWTESPDFPTSGPVQGYRAGVDAFVVKLSAAGSLIYSTYIGGSGDDRGFAIAVDGSGNSYVTGWTYSSDFPTRAALRSVRTGFRDAFILKLNPAGNALLYSTYLGGSNFQRGSGIAVDGSGNAYVTGDTDSLNFPVVNAFQVAKAGLQDGFVAKVNSTGSALLYSTFLGGAAEERANGIAIDAAGNAYITGRTTSNDFPTVSALQPSKRAGQDAFLAKLSGTGAVLVYSTYLGGQGGTVGFNEEGLAVAVDASGQAHVTGTTSSTDFPVQNAFQPALAGGGNDAFVSKFSADGRALVYSSFLGGSSLDVGTGIAVGPEGVATVVGYTLSTDFPAVNAVQSRPAGQYDVFVTEVDGSGSRLLSSTYFGGSGSDAAASVAVDGRWGKAFVAGQSLSLDLPLQNPVQAQNLGGYGGFVSQIATRPYCSSVGPVGVETFATTGTLDLYAYGVQNANEVGFGAWSAVNDQDDFIWYPGLHLGGGTWKASIDLSNHRPGSPDSGVFVVHVWMSGSSSAFCGGTTFIRSFDAPSCSGVGPTGVITTATSGTLNFYAYGVSHASAVSFAVWSVVNGQDDLTWYPGVDQGGGTWRASINLANHRPGSPDYGLIVIHVWMSGFSAAFCGGVDFTRNP